MSAIAEILALVNGNPDKTLDELILGEKTFVATSDTVLKVLGSMIPVLASVTPTESFSFKPKLSGTINIRMVTPAIPNPSYGIGDVKLIIFKNGSRSFEYIFTPSQETETTYLYSMNVTKGDKYSFTLQRNDGGLASYDTTKLEVSAIIVDSNYYE